MKPEIRTYENLETASLAAADLIEEAAAAGIRDKGFFTLVLTGGSSPRLLYRNLAAPPYSSRLAWQDIHFFWSDERCVEPGRPESNYTLAQEVLLNQVIAPPENIHRIAAERGSPEEAAQAYEAELRDFFRPHPELLPGELPRFDFILLGMGKDGHIASLFPDSNLLEEENRWVAAVSQPAGTPPLPRVTLTLPVLNNAQTIVFLIAGAEKEEILKQIQQAPDEAASRYPAARVKAAGRTIWLSAAEA